MIEVGETVCLWQIIDYTVKVYDHQSCHNKSMQVQIYCNEVTVRKGSLSTSSMMHLILQAALGLHSITRSCRKLAVNLSRNCWRNFLSFISGTDHTHTLSYNVILYSGHILDSSHPGEIRSSRGSFPFSFPSFFLSPGNSTFPGEFSPGEIPRIH